MAAKKKVVVTTPVVATIKTENKVVKGPHHIVKDGEIILDPNYVNPGVFSQP